MGTEIDKPSPRAARVAVNLAIAGAPYDEIAATCRYSSPAMARAAVEEQLAGMFDFEDRASLFKLVSARHQALIRSLHERATSAYVPDRDEFGDEIPGTLIPNPDHLAYAKTYADVLTRYSKLHGLDAPTQVQITPGGEQLEEVVQALVNEALAGEAQEADIFGDDPNIEDAVVLGPEDDPLP